MTSGSQEYQSFHINIKMKVGGKRVFLLLDFKIYLYLSQDSETYITIYQQIY
jgi:hypothetical protein